VTPKIAIRFVPRRNWFVRLFRRPDPEGAAARIWNLVATTPTERLNQEEIAAIRAEARVRYEDMRPEMRRIYSAMLHAACRDDDVSDAELAELRLLRRLLALTDADVAESSAAVYKSRLASALKDEDLSDGERGRLKTLVSRLQLPAEAVAAAMKEEGGALMQRVMDRALKDRRLAPGEEAELRALGEQLGITPRFAADTAAALDRFRLYWRIEQGDLPRLTVGLNLKRGEECHFRTPATHLERRTVTRAIAYAGPTVSIPIVKGVRFRLGAIAPQRISQEILAPLDEGVLYITNRRLLFDGSKQSRTFELSKLINFTPYSDGLNIERDRGKDQVFQFEGEVELAAMILAAALARA
jgi:hypothetical protein